MEQLKLIPLNEEIDQRFYSLAAEYLPGSDQSKMRERVKKFPQAFIAAVLGEQVIGVAFGWERKLDDPTDNSFVLDGITIEEPYQKNGYGKILLKAFGEAAKKYGASVVSVGSAGGYVEKFYIDCGFIPLEYKVWEDGSPVVERSFNSVEDYRSYQRKNPDGFVVMEKHI
ncbi:MAG: GNAT family N-acetyltransferase [Oscillospiraceae bacterium]|nr:GNAT family N-acetyltransferase [Oscillospiraceae bacterium]